MQIVANCRAAASTLQPMGGLGFSSLVGKNRSRNIVEKRGSRNIVQKRESWDRVAFG